MRPNDEYSIYEVFTPTSPARTTFVPRDPTTNDRLVNALRTPGKQLVLYGPTGSGKTTLLVNKLHELFEDHIVTNCISGLTYDQLLLNAIDQLNSFYEVERVRSKNRTTSPSLEIDSFGIKATAGMEVNDDKQTKHQRILSPQLTPQTLARLLGEARCCWVIEDFHKVDSSEKTRLAQGIKVFVDMSDTYKDLKIVVIGAADTASQVIEYEPELRNRVSEIHVPLMTDEEIRQIIERGEVLLNFSISSKAKEIIIRHATGIASTCHQLCLNLCFAAGIEHTSKQHQSLDDELVKAAIELYMKDASATFQAALDRALYRPRNTKFNDRRLILEALLQFGHEGASKEELFSKISGTLPEYPRRNLTHHLAQLQREEFGALIRFDSTRQLYSFIDPFRRTFIQSSFELLEGSRRGSELIGHVPVYEEAPGEYGKGDEFVIKKVDFYPLIKKTWAQQLKYYFENPRGLSYYLSGLKRQIEEMPFLYRDLHLQVVEDFVPPEIREIDLVTGQNKSRAFARSPVVDSLKHTRHIVLLGTGTGKTTFMRFAALSVINRKLRERTSLPNFFYEQEDAIPFFIPLKAVDISVPHPIIRFLLNTNQLLRQAGGTETLFDLARERRLFLLLDGYDEIPFTDTTSKSFVQEELGWILGERERYRGNDRLHFLYELMSECRVWISSRKEFYFMHPPYAGTAVMQNARGFEICGLSNNRITLVEKIFGKYKATHSLSSGRLSAEYFLNQIDEAGQEWTRLSYSPLFLSVMCYVYVHNVLTSGEIRLAGADNVSDLILKCVSLLLNDLDEYKVRNFSAAQRAFMLTVRNSYTEEKLQFLFFFAARVFSEQKSHFDIDYIKEKARLFFTQETEIPHREQILRDLDHDSINSPNLVLQLINSGVFVLIGTYWDRFLYDFPHHLFKEVLASKYYKRLSEHTERN